MPDLLNLQKRVMNRVLLKELVKYFSKQSIERASIIGSYARSEENPQRDIDFIVKNFGPEAGIILFKYHIVN